MSRQLATVQRVKVLEEIPGKDKIVLASFEGGGFKVIVSKEETKVGDLVVYFEADTLLPDKPEFEFLRARCWTPKWNGHRVRCMKMGGVFSEGLSLSLKDLNIVYAAEGEDFTDRLGVRKYDPEAMEESALLEKARQHGKVYNFFYRFAFFRKIIGFYYWLTKKKKQKYSFPDFIAKTDETRVQNLNVFVDDKWKDLQVYISEKINGQSCTCFIRKGKFGVCSRNLMLKEDDSKYWQIVKTYNIEEILRNAVNELKVDLAIQMENCGPGIQGNNYGFTELRSFIFNVYDIDHKVYCGLAALQEFSKKSGLSLVPILETRKFDWAGTSELTKYADGYSVFGDNKVLREGIVIRPLIPLPPERGMSNIWSLKVISPSFILKHQ